MTTFNDSIHLTKERRTGYYCKHRHLYNDFAMTRHVINTC